jgi:hypothetical protein
MGFDLRDVAGTIASNIIDPGGIGREVVKRSAGTLAGMFSDATAPFLGPIDNIMKVISPRFTINGNFNANATLSGGTTHSFVFPQLPSLPGASGAGDVTGGLLSDLAFDSEALRKTESDLRFLSSAIRRGVYPHRADSFFLGVSAVPKLADNGTMNGDYFLRVTVKDVDDNTSGETEFMFGIRGGEMKERVDMVRMRMGEKTPVRELAAAVERSELVQLRAERGRRRRLMVEVKVNDLNGGAIANFNFLRELRVWIERRNDGYTDVLHHFVWHEPGEDKIALAFPLERIEYISDSDDNRMQAVGRDGGRLASAANELDQALAVLDAGAVPVPEGKGTERLGELLAQRVQRAEVVREHLWTARRKLVRLQAAENVFDYRLRFKLRLENCNAAKRTITRLRMRSPGVPNAEIELPPFELPRQSRYDITVYPLRQDADTLNEATLETGETKENLTLSLVTGLGLAENVVRSAFPKKTTTQNPVDTAKLSWAVADTAPQ